MVGLFHRARDGGAWRLSVGQLVCDFVSEETSRRTVYVSKPTVGFGFAISLAGLAIAYAALHRLGLLF